ncbi:hypothetical protein BGZ63DRAFT_400243 [Mariannaea sp. PMI_226]|nr:hypothetical protein BGZ63DRAFT_400243 [Mariannaea sp. PMI_226]
MDTLVEQVDLASKARQTWRSALKLRKHLTKQLEKLPKDNSAGVDITQFETIESILEKFRLACVSTIFLDFEYAIAERADHILWTVHTSINHEYRRTLARLKQLVQAEKQQQQQQQQKGDKPSNDKRNNDKQKADKQSPQKQKDNRRNVEKRKLGDKYLTFLNIAQEFYKGYIQRLSARYDIPELKRIAHGIEVKETPASDIISPVPAQLYQIVLKSCHFTLICLGDLARYQIQAGLRKSSYRISMAYYSLAYDLKTDSGYAFHQMGIISLEEGKDLDVIYYFYRGIAVEDPHPNAISNLESKFKTILQPDKNVPRKGPRVPHDAFATWFGKLHAVFYKGEVLSQSSELEREVLHRLDMATKSSSYGETLFKMILINIASYFVASKKYTEAASIATSKFCQNTLRLNAQFILAISNTLEAELTEITNRESNDPKDPATEKTSPVIECLLPLLRTCTMWLVTRRVELFGAAEALGSVVPDMVKALAKVFTLLCTDTYTQEELATCPYLLAEDMETRGLLPLSPDQVPEACRSYVDENGALKPHLTSEENRLEPFQETLARILDILRCAYFLAEDSSVPLAYRVSEKALTFEYEETVPRGTPADYATASRIDSHAMQPAQDAEYQMSDAYRAARPVRNRHADGGAPGASSKSAPAPAQPQPAATGSDDAETTVINMLAPFLKPPTPQPFQSRSHDETSYGMHTATANEVFGMLPSEPSPTTSIPSGKFEPLPWNWVYTPKPHHKAQDSSVRMAQEAFVGPVSPVVSGRLSKDFTQLGNLDDPFVTPERSFNTTLNQRPASRMMGSPRAVSAAEEAHRHNLLQSFAGSSAPRTSSFSQWGQNSSLMPKETVPPSWGHQQQLNGHPVPSLASAFSHPSSLYQGTPATGAAFGIAPPGIFTTSHFAANHGSSGQEHSSSGPRFQMNDTTSSYDAAILQAAFYGNK